MQRKRDTQRVGATVEASVRLDVTYSPLADEGPAALLLVPDRLKVRIHIQDEPYGPVDLVDAELVLVDGVYVVVAITMHGVEESGVDWDRVSRLPFRRLIAQGIADGIHARIKYPDGYVEKADASTDTAWRTANLYAIARAMGESPTKAVAEAFGITHAAATQRVKRARDKGYLRATTRGKAN